jgi:hypothetical protein
MEYKEGDESYARFILMKDNYKRGITAWVKITKVNGEFVEFIDNDKYKYKVKKTNFEFKIKV